MNSKDLAILEFLSNDFESIDDFTDLYECMLNEYKAKGDKVTLRAMRKILLKQAKFLMFEWLKEKGIIPNKYDRKENVQ